MYINGLKHKHIVPSLISIVFCILLSILGMHLCCDFHKTSLKQQLSYLLPCCVLLHCSVVGLYGWRDTQNDVGSQRVELQFRGKFANVLTRVEL